MNADPISAKSVAWAASSLVSVSQTEGITQANMVVILFSFISVLLISESFRFQFGIQVLCHDQNWATNLLHIWHIFLNLILLFENVLDSLNTQ